jgi:hypothetical protein
MGYTRLAGPRCHAGVRLVQVAILYTAAHTACCVAALRFVLQDTCIKVEDKQFSNTSSWLHNRRELRIRFAWSLGAGSMIDACRLSISMQIRHKVDGRYAM